MALVDVRAFASVSLAVCVALHVFDPALLALCLYLSLSHISSCLLVHVTRMYPQVSLRAFGDLIAAERRLGQRGQPLDRCDVGDVAGREIQPSRR
jgi:hypothetical protein